MNEKMKRIGRFRKIMESLDDGGAFMTKKGRFMNAVENGRALREIRDGKLYLSMYKTFNKFISKEFDFTPQNAYNLIAASNVYDELQNKFTDLPETVKECIQIFQESRRTNQSYSDVWSKMSLDGLWSEDDEHKN